MVALHIGCKLGTEYEYDSDHLSKVFLVTRREIYMLVSYFMNTAPSC